MDGLIALLIIGALVSALSKRAKEKAAQSASGRPAAPARPEPKPAAAPAAPVRPMHVDLPGQRTLPYFGGESAPPSPFETAEGEDPCHEDMLRPVRQGRPSDSAPERTYAVTIPGLELSFDGDAMVKGVIYSEILNRKPVRRIR